MGVHVFIRSEADARFAPLENVNFGSSLDRHSKDNSDAASLAQEWGESSSQIQETVYFQSLLGNFLP